MLFIEILWISSTITMQAAFLQLDRSYVKIDTHFPCHFKRPIFDRSFTAILVNMLIVDVQQLTSTYNVVILVFFFSIINVAFDVNIVNSIKILVVHLAL